MRRVNMRRGRRSSAAAPAVIATLLTVAAVVVFGGSALAASAIGAAAGIPLPAASGSAGAQPAAPAQRACSPADLAIGVGATGAYQGHATQELTLTNRAGDACFLPGAPSTAVLFDDGSQQATDPGQFATSRVDLAPGQSALLLVGTPGTCAGADPSHSRVATRMALGLSVGGSILAQGVNLDVQCGQSSVVLMLGR